MTFPLVLASFCGFLSPVPPVPPWATTPGGETSPAIPPTTRRPASVNPNRPQRIFALIFILSILRSVASLRLLQQPFDKFAHRGLATCLLILQLTGPPVANMAALVDQVDRRPPLLAPAH